MDKLVITTEQAVKQNMNLILQMNAQTDLVQRFFAIFHGNYYDKDT